MKKGVCTAWHAMALIAALILSLSAHAADSRLTPESYVELDQRIQLLTVQGMAQRLNSLQSAPHDRAGQFADSNQTQEKIREALEERGLSMTAFLAYGARHEEEIQTWLQGQSVRQSQYSDLQRQHDELSAKIQKIRPVEEW